MQLTHRPVMRAGAARAARAAGGALALAFVAVLLGLMVAVLPALFFLPILIVPLAIVFCLLVPEWATVLLLAVVFGVIPEAVLPRLPMAGGTLRAEELGLVGFTLLLLVKHWGRAPQLLATIRPFAWTILPVVLVAVFSAATSLLFKTAPAKEVLLESKAFLYWLMLPLLALAIDTPERMARFRRLLLALALVLATGMIVQSVTGVAIFGRGYFNNLYTVTESTSGTIRSTTPGMFLMAAALIYLAASHAYGSRLSLWWAVPASALLLGGVVVGFGRGLWFAIAVGLLLIGWFCPNRRFLGMLAGMVVSLVLILAVAAVAKPQLIDAAANRILSIGAEVDRGTSFARRKVEIHYGTDAVKRAPVLGLGLGAQYKPAGPEYQGWPQEIRYIHNTFMNVAAKQGLVGLVVFVLSLGWMLYRSWQSARRCVTWRALHYTVFWLVLATGVLTAMTQPNLLATYGVTQVALGLFMSEWHRRQEQTAGSAASSAGQVAAQPAA